MQALVHADLSAHRLTKSLGGSSFAFPDLIQSDEIRLGLRLSEALDGESIETDRTITDITASIGFIDLRPTAGKWALKINSSVINDGINTTAKVDFNVSGTDLYTALAACSASVSAWNVDEVSGGFVVYYTDGSQITDLTGVYNSLDATSFIRVQEFQVDGDYKYEIRLVQAPLASTSSFSLVLPPPPAITSILDGGEDASSGAAWNEIQALTIIPSFRGTYQIKRGYKRTDLLDINDGPDEIEEALLALIVDGETFTVTNPTTNVAHIEFGGDAGGVNQDLLEIEVFSAPPGDPTFVLDLNTHAVSAALRSVKEIKPQLEIELTIEDEDDDSTLYTVTVHRGEVKILRELVSEDATIAANVDWLSPPSGLSYNTYGSGQVITGSQHYIATIGDGSSGTLNIAHNLGTEDLHVSLRDNSSGDVQEGADYTTTINGINDLDLVFPGTPASNSLVVVVTTAGPVSAFASHTHVISEITGLQTVLDNLGLRLQVIEDLVPTGAIGSSVTTASGTIASWTLPDTFEIYPARGEEGQTATAVKAIDESLLPRKGGRLLPSVLDEAPTQTATIPGAPAVNTVYQNTSGGELTLSGFRGIRSRTIQNLEFFAWDALGFYQVETVLTAGAQAFGAATVETDGTNQIEFVLSGFDATYGPGATHVGLVEIRDMAPTVASITDGYYPYKTNSTGSVLTILDDGAFVAAGPTSLVGTETFRPIGSNTIFEVSGFVVSGTNLVTLTIDGSDANSPTGYKLFANVSSADWGSSAVVDGIYELTSIGTNKWTFAGTSLTNGTYTEKAVAEMPQEVNTLPSVTALTGEINRFYPVDMKRELFKFHVNEKQFRLKSTFSLDFSLELAAIKCKAEAQWGVIIQTGEVVADKQDSSGVGEGHEIAGIRWNAPSLDQVVHLTSVPAIHNFGLRVYRSVDDAITASSVLYGLEEGGAQAPRSAGFVVRALLHRFDVDDYTDDPTGFIAFSGLTIDENVGEAKIAN